MKVRIIMLLDYDLPDDARDMMEAYGTTDPEECFRIDLENDPAATLCDYADIVSWDVSN